MSDLETLSRAIARQFDLVDALVRADEDHDAWTAALDVERTPAPILPFLALFVGDRLPANLAEAEARQRIRETRVFKRGTPAAIAQAAADTLTGARQVRIVERTSSAYTMTVITRTAETPDAAATMRALLTQKPAGIVLTHVVSDAPIIDEGSATIDDVAAAIDTATLIDVTT